MAIPTPSPGGHFVAPTWWHDPSFSLSNIAEFIDAPVSTVHLWWDLARASGHEVGKKFGGRVLYNCHELYVACLLAKLRQRGVRINARVIDSAFRFAASGPLPIHGCWDVFGGEGATLEVPAWLCWTATRAHATRYYEGGPDRV